MKETWASPAGFSKYEVSNDGYGPDQRPVRSVDRQVGARSVKGVVIKVTVGTHGYPQVKVYDDDKRQRTMTVHSLVMLAHTGRQCPPGMTVRHYDDDPFNNRWRPGPEAVSVAAGGNLFYGDRDAQEADRARNTPPRPVRLCVRCGAVLSTNGRRCHGCVVALGVQAAGLLRGGHSASEIAAELGYPSVDGILALAITHGGYGQSWPQRVMATVRHLLRKAHRNAA